jgi:hypothetical protein
MSFHCTSMGMPAARVWFRIWVQCYFIVFFLGGGNGGSATPCAFQINLLHKPIKRDDRHLLAHAMASGAIFVTNLGAKITVFAKNSCDYCVYYCWFILSHIFANFWGKNLILKSRKFDMQFRGWIAMLSCIVDLFNMRCLCVEKEIKWLVQFFNWMINLLPALSSPGSYSRTCTGGSQGSSRGAGTASRWPPSTT